jgi:hypothetical protein
MRMIARATMGLGLLGAAALSASTPSVAQGFYLQAPGIEFGVGQPWYGRQHYYGDAYAYQRGPAFRADPYYAYGQRSHRPWRDTDIMGRTWDPYAMRYD